MMFRFSDFFRISFFLLAIPFVLNANAQSPGCSEFAKSKIAAVLGVSELVGILSIEVARCEDLILQSNLVGFRLDENSQKVYGGIRSEVALDIPFREGESIKYSWDVMFAKDMTFDVPMNRWWLIAQWHDQPDRRIGETWSGFPPRSPPFALYLEERNGQPGMGIIRNGNSKLSWAKVPLGEWLSVSVSVHWSSKEDGEVVFDVAGHPEFFLRFRGKNMHNSFQHYLKFGQYRHPQIKAGATVYFRNLEFSRLAPPGLVIDSL